MSSDDREGPVRGPLAWGAAAPLLAGVAVLVGLPMVIGRVPAGHDLVVYLINAQQMADNLRQGALFPAWGGGYNAGFGAPTLLFFPPLTSYVHALPVVLGIPVAAGLSLASLTGLFLSGVAIFGWLRSAGLASGAIQAALIYMIAPYRLIDLYYRSALAEHWAFVWPPVILWAGTARGLPGPARAALIAGSVAMLLIANIPLATLFGLGLGAWFLASGQLRGRRLPIATGAVLGFGVAAFALVPQSMSSSLLSVERYYGSDAGRFRPSANTLFSGEVGALDFNTVVSLSVVVVVVLVVAAFGALTPEARRRPEAMITVGSAIALLLAASGPAGPVWEMLPLLSRFQFPWRVASLLTLMIALIAALLAPRRGWCFVALVAVISVPFSGWTRTVPLAAFNPTEPPRVAPGKVFPDPRVAWEAGSGGWYWRHHNLAEIWFVTSTTPPFLLPDLAGAEAPQLDLIRGRPAVLIEAPATPVRVLRWQSTRRTVEVDVPRSGRMMWRALDFPGMRITVDGRAVPITVDRLTGLVTHPVEQGTHRVEWSWTAFPALRRARWVTVAAIVLTATLLAVGLAQRVKHGASDSPESGGPAAR